MHKLAHATIARKPDDESGAPGPVEVADEPQRKKIANRDWINDAGEEVQPEEATAVRYEFLGKGDVAGDGKAFTFKLANPGTAAAMLAGFGALTLMGNLTNTWLAEKGDKLATPYDAIAERFALLDSGKWIDRAAGGGVGAKVDRDALAEAITQVKEAAGFAAGDTRDEYKARARQKLEDDPAFLRQIRQKPEIANAYAAIVGKTAGKPLDDMLADV